MSNFKVYRYGLLAPTANAQLVRDQMYAAHRYHNTLIEIERGKRDAVRLITRDSSEKIRQLELQFQEAEELEKKIAKEIKTQHIEMRSRTSTQTDKEDLKAARSKKKECRALLVEARRELKTDATLIAEQDLIKGRALQLIHSARKYCGVYWGTYLLVDDAMDASRKMPLYDGVKDNNPRFVPWKHEGSVGVQLQGGLDVKDAFGTNTQIRIDPVDEKAFYAEQRKDRRKASKTSLHLRVGSDSERKPVWATWPMIMHRALPAGGLIKGAAVHLKRVGPVEEWSVSITVDMSGTASPTLSSTGAVALDIGWRDMKDTEGKTTGFRIAKWRNENNEVDEVKLDPFIISGIRKANDIRGVRDDNFNTARLQLVEWLKNNPQPTWLSEKTETLVQWRSIARLSSLVMLWKSNRFDSDQVIYEAMEKWRYHDYHLWSWESSQRIKSLRRRKEFYRVLAAKLADKHQTLVLEDFDLSDVSETPQPDDADDNQRSRSNKTLAAPSEFRLALINAFAARHGKLVLIDPKGTSYTCHLCASKEHLDSTTHIHTCSKCGETWDREDNATANLLARWREQSSDAKNAANARNDETVSENMEILESRYQRRNRAKLEKLAKKASARKEKDKAA